MVKSGIGPMWHAEGVHPRNPTAAPSRVLFYGVTGSGKSSAARAYAARMGLPEFSADDDVGWLPGWRQPNTAQQRDLAARIAGQDQWVLDSAYGVWRDLVVPRAELIVGLDYPRWLSLLRLIRRSVRRVAVREEVCNGNRKSFKRLFARDSIIGWHFRSFRRKRRVMRALQRVPGKAEVLLFRHPRELEAWLQRLPQGEPRPSR